MKRLTQSTGELYKVTLTTCDVVLKSCDVVFHGEKSGFLAISTSQHWFLKQKSTSQLQKSTSQPLALSYAVELHLEPRL